MKTISREEYREYLWENRKNKVSTKLNKEMRDFIKANEQDIRKAFIETNISTIGFSIKPKPKITLYQVFCTEYPFITISEENFNKAYKETHTTNLDHLKDYILAKGLEEEIELWQGIGYHNMVHYIGSQNGYQWEFQEKTDSGNKSLLSISEKVMPYATQNETT